MVRFIFFLVTAVLSFSYFLVKQLTIKSSKDPSYQHFQSYADPLYSPWLKDPTFRQIHESYSTADNFLDGRYIQYALSRSVIETTEGGDIIECGVFKGKSLDIFASVLDRWDRQGRKIYGFDSFKGLAAPGKDDFYVMTGGPFFYEGAAAGWDEDTLRKALSHHKCQIQLIKGWIPQSFSSFENKRFCFAHIDVDLYQATYDSLAFIFPRMVRGGIILFDDYGFPMCPGARKGVDEYLKDKSEIVIQIPTGQAFLIKH